MRRAGSSVRRGKYFVAGHRGLVGSAIVRALLSQGVDEILTIDRSQVDLRDQLSVINLFDATHPDFVFLAAAKVGGIMANANYPADFLYDNLAIQTNVIHSAYKAGVQKLVFLGSSCVYPKSARQPIKEEYLLTGPLEPTNEAYAVAKIAGLKLAAAYRSQYGFNAISLMPTNLYGPGDNFNLQSSHVLPALIRRFHDAKTQLQRSVTIWGTGSPLREFLHVDDLAQAACFSLEHYEDGTPLNVGSGEEISIAELAKLIARKVDYTGEIRCDTSKPDGTPRKLVDASRINALGWRPRIGLEEGVHSTYAWFCENYAAIKS